MLLHCQRKFIAVLYSVCLVFFLILSTELKTTSKPSAYPLHLVVNNEIFSDVMGLKPIAISQTLCENLPSNLTNGKWVLKSDILGQSGYDEGYRKLLELEEKMDRHLAEFRIKRGVHTRLWRSDLKCGLKNLQEQPKGRKFGEPVGSWCDAKSARPCCSDEDDGMCLPPSQGACVCPRCIDMRKIYHAELSEWLPNDPRCRRRHYDAKEACNILQDFSEVHFVGDSFVRKMARSLVLTLRSDPVDGAKLEYKDPTLEALCRGPNQFYWTECKISGLSQRIEENLRNNSPLCTNPEVPLFLYEYYNLDYAERFLELIRKIDCKKSLVVLGVGGHMNCDDVSTIGVFLKPAVEYIREKCWSKENRNVRSPRVLFLYPDTIGLLKAPHYRKSQGRNQCNIFAEKMKKYCDDNDIAVIDFRKVTSGVHSYDGAHHGIGVNVIKTQLFLNYLDSVRRKKT